MTPPPATDDESPAVNDTLAPAPLDDEPPTTSTDPADTVPAPLLIDTEPLVPLLMLLFTSTAPLSPAAPDATALLNTSLPLDVLPTPLLTDTEPPIDTLDTPPATTTSPASPAEFDEPVIVTD